VALTPVSRVNAFVIAWHHSSVAPQTTVTLLLSFWGPGALGAWWHPAARTSTAASASIVRRTIW
jgi:hypothetical protein